MDPHTIYGILLTALPILLSLSVHEFAHARTALAFGDPTAKMMGRCTINPLVHLHPIGTLGLIFGGFGWAKPVPVNPNNLHPRRLGNISVSLAGPLSNVGIAILCVIALRVMVYEGVHVNLQAGFTPTDLAAFLLIYTVIINLNLCIFNLIPLFPLDGHHIGREMLSPGKQQGYMQWQVKFGMALLLAMVFLPRLLQGTNLAWVDPLGWYLGQIMPKTLVTMLGDNGCDLGLSALYKFHSYLAWMR